MMRLHDKALHINETQCITADIDTYSLGQYPYGCQSGRT